MTGQAQARAEPFDDAERVQELAHRIGRVAEVEVQRYASQQVVAGDQQATLGLEHAHVRGSVAGGLVHAPRTEVAVDRDPRDQIAVRLDHSGDARFARAPLGGPQPQWLLGHAAVAGDLDAAVEHRLRVLGHARHVLVVGMQPQLTPGAGDDRGGLSVVVGVGVRAHDQAHLLEAQVAHVERPFQLRERVGLMHARVEQHHAVAGPDGPRVAVGHARPGKRQAQAVHAR